MGVLASSLPPVAAWMPQMRPVMMQWPADMPPWYIDQSGAPHSWPAEKPVTYRLGMTSPPTPRVAW